MSHDDNNDPAVTAAADLIETLGLNSEQNAELADTPERFVSFLREAFSGVDEPAPRMSTFEAEYVGEQTDPVIISELPFYSMCVHHLVPFFGSIDVAYVPAGTMTGFGSVGRVIDYYSQRPQVQERLGEQIADHIDEALEPRGILVRCVARQMCMEMRGAKKQGRLVSTASRGELTDGSLRRHCLDQFDQSSSQ